MERPSVNLPYLRFESRPVEDRAATIESGSKKWKDIDYVIITPPGRKDEVEKIATEWLKDIEDKALNRNNSQFSADNAYSMEVVGRFKKMYEMYKRDEVVEDIIGTPIRLVGWLSEAEKRNLLGANIRSLEDLASVTEEGIKNIGIGGRDLKKKAVSALESAEGGKTALQIEALQQQVAQLMAALEKANKKSKKNKED